MVSEKFKDRLGQKMGIASLAMAGLEILLIFFLFFLIAPYVNTYYPSEDPGPAMLLLGMVVVIFLLLVTGSVLGLFALHRSKNNRLAGWAFFFNIFFLAIFVLALKFLFFG